MILSWRRKRRGAGHTCERSNDHNLDMEIAIPMPFRCPISLDLMKDPVTLSTGITYDRESIEKWVESGNHKCPVTNQVLTSFDQIPNHSIRKMIQGWCVDNRSHGIQRIPTPRIPVSPYEVSECCKRIMMATQKRDSKKCRELVGKIKNWGKESERNKRCVVENGTGSVLWICFESFASDSIEKFADLLAEILSVLTWTFRVDNDMDAESQTTRSSSLHCLVWFLKNGDLSARQNSVSVLKELLSTDQTHANSLSRIEGAVEALVNLIKEPICPSATKASLTTVFHLISPSNMSDVIVSTFVEMGLVNLITEILVDGDKGVSERALGVLDRICECEDGREKVYENDLVVGVLVKKILRISDFASELSVSVLWKLCKSEKRDGGRVIVEAIQVGGFQKLLALLQIGCIKHKVTELLKLMNHYRAKLDCRDSLIHLERSY